MVTSFANICFQKVLLDHSNRCTGILAFSEITKISVELSVLTSSYILKELSFSPINKGGRSFYLGKGGTRIKAIRHHRQTVPPPGKR